MFRFTQFSTSFPGFFLFHPQGPTRPTACFCSSQARDQPQPGYFLRKEEGGPWERGCSLTSLYLVLSDLYDFCHRYFDIMKLSACKFYSLLMSDVEELCQNQPRNQRPDNVDCFMLCLAFRLSKLDREWAEYIPHRLVLIFVI